MQTIDVLIAENKGLVYKQLHKFYLVDDPDAESAALWALYRAITTFDNSKHTLLSTYATCCIYNALGDYVRTLKRQQKVPVVSYNNLVFEDTEYEEMLSDDITTEDICLKGELVDITQRIVEDIISKTKSEKQRLILMTYRDYEYDIQTNDLAKETGVSQSYVSQVINEFMFKVKKKVEGYYRE